MEDLAPDLGSDKEIGASGRARGPRRGSRPAPWHRRAIAAMTMVSMAAGLAACERALGRVHLEGTIRPSQFDSCLYLGVGDVNYWLATLPNGYSLKQDPIRIVGPDGTAIASAGDRLTVDGERFDPGGDSKCQSFDSVHVTSLSPDR